MNPISPVQFIAKTRERARRSPLLWSLACSLAALGCWEAERLSWWSHGSWCALALAVVSIILLFRWFVLGRTLTETALARQLDSSWALQARLESSVDLQHAEDALAAAQRTDAHEHARMHRPPRELEWFLGKTVLTAAALFVISELGVELFHRLSLPRLAAMPAIAAPTVPDAKPAEMPKSPVLQGRITWRSPESEIKATTIEEVPLVAVAESNAGYKKLTLEIALNGEPKLSRPAEAAVLASVAQPGPHAVSLSLFLDEVGAQEFDIVSYHLRGELAPDVPAVVSPLQFVQIRPSREDATQGQDESDAEDGTKMVNVMRRLKIAQLELIKKNFLLAHAAVRHDDKVWRDANEKVANDQELLASKTAEFRGVAIKSSLATIVVDNLAQAEPLMRDAAKEITAEKNEPAGIAQGKALALLTATEKILRKTLSQGKATPDIEDPFKDQQSFTMPERAATPAGRLEELARKQEKIARALNENSQDQVAAQSDVSRELERLLAEKELDADVQGEVAAAAKDAAEANRQLAQSDTMAARGPATAAADALAHAVAEQERKGRQTALSQLDQMRRELNDAAQQGRSSEMAAELNKLAGELAQAAGSQQKKGSGTAAGQMLAAGKEAREAARREANEVKAGARAVASSLAAAEAELSGRGTALARVAHQLDRVERELGEPGNSSRKNILKEAELAAQMAAVLLKDAQGRSAAKEVISGFGDGPPDGTGPEFQKFKDRIHKLSVLVQNELARGAREEIVRRFNPDDVDPAYRSAIDAYFERLSREGAR